MLMKENIMNDPMSKIYNNPIWVKACSKLTEDDIQFFKDVEAWKIDLSNKKELKKRFKEIELRMVADFNFRELREFIKIMNIITIYNSNKYKNEKKD